MGTKTIQIIVATHKNVGDSTDDNIFAKNDTWSELKGLYQDWKNLQCEYIGLVQYR